MRNILIAVPLLIALTGCSNGPSGNSNSAIANNATSVNRASSGPQTGNSQTVTIDSPDGLKLVGTFLDAGKPNSPSLLLLHQWQSDRHSYDEFAKRENEKGFNVLSIDGRGFGESTKKADGSAVSAGRSDEDVKAMLGDVGAAVDFLSKQKNVAATKIGIIGASYGSSLAIIYAADHPDISAVALLSPGLNYFGNMQTEPALKKYGDRPLLMIAAEDDKDSADAVRALAAAGNNSKYEQVIYPAGGHGTALFNVPAAGTGGTSSVLERFFMTRFGMEFKPSK